MATYIDEDQNAELDKLLLEHKAAMYSLNAERNAKRLAKMSGLSDEAYSKNIKYCKPPEKLGKYILLVFDGIMHRPNFRGYDGELRDDIVDNAMIRIQTALHRYDPDKGTGFNFLTMVLTQSIRSTLGEFNKRKNEEDKVEHVTLTTYSDETVHIPVYDDEIEVNSDFYNKHISKDNIVDDDPIFEHMMSQMTAYKTRAKKDSIPLEDILKSVYEKRKRTQDIVVDTSIDAKERARLSALKYYYAHKDKASARRKAWAAANPDKVKQYDKTKNARKTEARRKAKALLKQNAINMSTGDTNDYSK
jgi:hypothetical protein